MLDQRPFIYVASLRRTGSTVISESLTLLPHCFIFREPRLGHGRFKVKPSDLSLFRERGLDLEAFRARWENEPGPSAPYRFRDELMPRLADHVSQVGVKEIGHEKWRVYLDAFPDMKVVLTARDPRDVYISVAEWSAKGRGKFAGNLSPSAVAGELSAQFRFQLEMLDATDAFKVRYEDFCADPNLYEDMKAFVGSGIPDVGEVGRFNASNPKRTDEFELHGEDVTTRRVGRWREVGDRALKEDAQRMLDLMPEYCAFWGYG